MRWLTLFRLQLKRAKHIGNIKSFMFGGDPWLVTSYQLKSGRWLTVRTLSSSL